MLGISEKTSATWPKLVLVTLTLAVGTAVSGGIGLVSAQGTDVNESATLRLTSTGVIRSPLQGFARLQLHIGEPAGTSFRASAKVESDGLVRNRFYAMWLVAPDGNRLLIDSARADEECEVDPDTGEEEDCEVVVDLRSHLTEAPFRINTLVGLTINIREQVIGTASLAPVLATGTVPSADREISTATMRPPNVGANVGSPFGDLFGPPATIRSSSGPPIVGTNIGSPFGEETRKIEDEERRLEEEEEEREASSSSKPPSAETNVGSSIDDEEKEERRLEEEEEEQEIRFPRKPPVVGMNFGSPFDEARRIEDEDRRLEEEEEAQDSG